jgi:hypothetical protein
VPVRASETEGRQGKDAREHLHDLAAHLAFITPDPAQWPEDRNADLDAGNIQAIIDAASAYPLDGSPTALLVSSSAVFVRWD